MSSAVLDFRRERRGRRNIRLHRRVRKFAGFLYGYLRIAPQPRHEMMILELAGRSLIRAFFPGTRGWPQFLQRKRFFSCGILTFVRFEIFLASPVYLLENSTS